MNYYSNDEFLAIVETKIDHRQVNLISPVFITPGHYRSKVYDEKTHMTKLEEIQGQNIHLADEFSLPKVDGINHHLFQLIILACNNLQLNLKNGASASPNEEAYSSIGVKNNTYTRMTHSFGDTGIHLLTKGLIEKIDQQEIDWGLTYYFSENKKNQVNGINVELIHPQCCCTFFIPVKCTKGIFTTLRIKARNIKLLNTHYNYAKPTRHGLQQYKRIGSHELLQQTTQSDSLEQSMLEVKFMLRRFARNWRFLVTP
jgi:hypothetical protein